MNKVVIFDFDGVLADSFRSVYTINKLSAEFVSKKITEEDYNKMFIGKFHCNLYNFLDLNEEELKIFSQHKNKIYSNHYEQADLFKFAPDLIKNLSKIAPLAIVSSAPEKEIRKMLFKYNLVDNFFMILGTNMEGKVKNIKKCVNSVNADDKHSFFISDTVGDINDGKEAGVKTIAVTWGFHSGDILRKAMPEFVVSDYREIIEIINEKK